MLTFYLKIITKGNKCIDILTLGRGEEELINE
jgi:hypothetical protein